MKTVTFKTTDAEKDDSFYMDHPLKLEAEFQLK